MNESIRIEEEEILQIVLKAEKGYKMFQGLVKGDLGTKSGISIYNLGGELIPRHNKDTLVGDCCQSRGRALQRAACLIYMLTNRHGSPSSFHSEEVHGQFVL